MNKKARQILFQTYWSAKGWREKTVTEPDNFLYAKKQAAKAFLSSLSARRRLECFKL